MKVGDRVRMAPMWKHEEATGVIVKLSEGFFVVEWDNINGHWYYDNEQARGLELL